MENKETKEEVYAEPIKTPEPEVKAKGKPNTSAIPALASLGAGVVAGTGVVPSALMAAGGSMAGKQLQAEIEHTPAKALTRFLDASIPGISNFAAGLPPDIQKEVSDRAMMEAPIEIGINLLAGAAGKAIHRGVGIVKGGKDYALNRVQTVARGMDTYKAELGTAVGKAIDTVGEAVVEGVDDVLAKLPDAAKVHLKQNFGRYGIASVNGKFTNSLKNVQKIKMAIGDLMNSGDWTKKELGIVKSDTMGVYKSLRDLMVKTRPEIEGVLKGFHNFMDDVYYPVSSVVYNKRGKVVEKKMRTALAPKAERMTKKAIEQLSDIDPDVSKAISEIKGYMGRQTLKDAMRKYTPWLLGAGALSAGISNVGKKISESVSSGSGEVTDNN